MWSPLRIFIYRIEIDSDAKNCERKPSSCSEARYTLLYSIATTTTCLVAYIARIKKQIRNQSLHSLLATWSNRQTSSPMGDCARIRTIRMSLSCHQADLQVRNVLSSVSMSRRFEPFHKQQTPLSLSLTSQHIAPRIHPSPRTSSSMDHGRGNPSRPSGQQEHGRHYLTSLETAYSSFDKSTAPL